MSFEFGHGDKEIGLQHSPREPEILHSHVARTAQLYTRAFFLAAQRAFMSTDSFFFAAGLIRLRFWGFLWSSPQLAFWAAEILARAEALMVRRFLPAPGAAFFALLADQGHDGLSIGSRSRSERQLHSRSRQVLL